MSLFKKDTGTKETSELTPKEAQTIYGYFRDGMDHTQMFKSKGIPFSRSEAVWDEIKRLENEANSLAMEGKLSSEKDLVAGLKSSLLNVELLVEDVIKYNPTYDEDRTFDEWLKGFSQEVV